MLLNLPTAEELFDRPRPPRLPHPAIPKDDESPAMEIADRECARLIVNACFFDPPITDAQIKNFSERDDLPFRDAELELRRLRA